MADGYKVAYVSGRRLPWRVHSQRQNPLYTAEAAFATEAEARAAQAEMNAPQTLYDIQIPELAALGRSLAKRR